MQTEQNLCLRRECSRQYNLKYNQSVFVYMPIFPVQLINYMNCIFFFSEKKTDCLDKVCDQSQSHDSICRKHRCVRNLYLDKFDHRLNRKK